MFVVKKNNKYWSGFKWVDKESLAAFYSSYNAAKAQASRVGGVAMLCSTNQFMAKSDWYKGVYYDPAEPRTVLELIQLQRMSKFGNPTEED